MIYYESYNHIQSHSVFYKSELVGCIINGLLYGDTIITAINYVSTNSPNKFILHQNYPNPFSLKTKIKFEIQKKSYVNLKIYDMRGSEMANLITQKEFETGEYEIPFEAGANGLSSGIYFCTMKAETENHREISIDTNKMMYIK